MCCGVGKSYIWCEHTFTHVDYCVKHSKPGLWKKYFGRSFAEAICLSTSCKIAERGEYRPGICSRCLATRRRESQVIGRSKATQVSSIGARVKGLVVGRLKIQRTVNTPEERERIREEKLSR